MSGAAAVSDAHLEHMIDAVAAASRVARRLQHDARRPEAPVKSDDSPVTVADFAVQAILVLALEEIADRRGGPLVVGEESAAALREPSHRAVRDAVVDAVRSWRDDVSTERVLEAIDRGGHDATAERWWTIDPIDGTRGFVRGQQYAVCLALVERGTVVFGALGCPNLPLDAAAPLEPLPATGSIVVAVRGAGAWQRDEAAPAEAGERLVRGERAHRHPILAASYHSSDVGAAFLGRLLERLGPGAVRLKVDSQCKYALVARGQVDAYVRMPRSARGSECVWDHAPGTLIATEAGATVTDVEGRPLDFGRGRRLAANRGIVCAARDLHGRLVELAQAAATA